MDIQTVVSRTSSFSELLPIAERAKVHFSFWGSGYVTVSGYEGTTSIDAIASRTIDMRKKFFELSVAEHEAGRLVSARIDILFDDQEQLVSEANCFSWTLGLIRILPYAIFQYLIYGDRGFPSNWRGHSQRNDFFDYYTRTQFQGAFGISPEEAERRGFVQSSPRGRTGGPRDLWCVEYHMRPRLVRSAP